MSNQDQLPTFVTAFEHWRINRNGRQLKQWRNTTAPTETTPQFVHLPISTSPTPSSVNVELRFANGDQMHLSGVVNSDMLVSLIGAMKS